MQLYVNKFEADNCGAKETDAIKKATSSAGADTAELIQMIVQGYDLFDIEKPTALISLLELSSKNKVNALKKKNRKFND